jgi:hypothetical protein
MLSREVSMSRSFRAPTPVAPPPKSQPPSKPPQPQILEKPRTSKDGVMLVESTPVKTHKNRADLPRRDRDSAPNGEDSFGPPMVGLLVASTPTKTKVRSR